MKHGEYWIGDPSIVLNNNNGHDWDDVLFHIIEGEVTYLSRSFGCYLIPDSKHVIVSEYGNKIQSPSGYVACIPTQLIAQNLKLTNNIFYGVECGVIIKFEKDFEIKRDHHIVTFGNFQINFIKSL